MPDPQDVATFRFEMIAPMIDRTVSEEERKKLLRERTARKVLWPSGDERPVPRATLYRWAAAYEKHGFGGLLPKGRKDRGVPRRDRSAWVDRAIHLLLERPSRSLTLLIVILRTYFPDLLLSRATLDRELKRHPAYAAVLGTRRRDKRLRGRFQADRPHRIWQFDGKGSFAVRFQDGSVRRVTVLTVLDDFSRAVLGVAVAATEHLGAAVRAFRRAAARWGLPDRIYCDRHSVYDSTSFRGGLAILGVHRIGTRPRNAPARGKIEAYHRALEKWFVRELPHQVVEDEAHLEDLLLGVIEIVYQKHRHRGLKMPPEVALAGKRSDREASPGDLARAFRVRKTLKAHKKTAEVSLPGGTFRVPARFADRRVRLSYDPAEPERAWMIRQDGEEVPIESAGPRISTGSQAARPRRGAGALQRILDNLRGRTVPQAEAGYGLPEVFDAIAARIGRRCPATVREAEAVAGFWRDRGPFEKGPFETALERAFAELGPSRPISVILDFIARLVRPGTTPHPKEAIP